MIISIGATSCQSLLSLSWSLTNSSRLSRLNLGLNYHSHPHVPKKLSPTHHQELRRCGKHQNCAMQPHASTLKQTLLLITLYFSNLHSHSPISRSFFFFLLLPLLLSNSSFKFFPPTPLSS